MSADSIAKTGQVQPLGAWIFRIVACICVFVMFAHELIGAPMVLPPLHVAEIDDKVVWLHHFSWHVGSIAVIAIAGMFFYASFRTGGLILAVVASLMCTAFALLAIALALFASPSLWDSPAPYVWSLIALMGGVGVKFAKS